MGEATAIEWCTHSWSPWHGCQHAVLPDGTEHPGCLNCYAETMAKRNPGTLGKWGADGTRILTAQRGWSGVRRWNARAQAAGVRESVFCSVDDPFEDWQGPILEHTEGDEIRRCTICEWLGTLPVICRELGPQKGRIDHCPQCGEKTRLATMGDCRAELFSLIDATPWLDWLLLTKRPQNVRRMLVPHCRVKVHGHVSQNEGDGYHLRRRENIWIGCSVSDQPTADALIPELLKCRDLSPVLFLSCEPLLGAVDIIRPCGTIGDAVANGWGKLGWVIVGGESGSNSRICHLDWVRRIVSQCQAAGVPYFVKQLGSKPYSLTDRISHPGNTAERPDGFYRFLNDKKGGDWSEWPEDLRVRQMPEAPR